MRISRTRAAIGGATALMAASVGVGYAFTSPGQGAKAATQPPGVTPDVRTQEIRRTVHVLGRGKPLPRGGKAGGAQTAGEKRLMPANPAVRGALTGAGGGPGGGSTPSGANAYSAAVPAGRRQTSPLMRTRTSGSSSPSSGSGGKKHHKKHLCTKTSGSPPPSSGSPSPGGKKRHKMCTAPRGENENEHEHENGNGD